MTRITKIFHIEAAHRLPLHHGKCQNIHGHTYKIEITLQGPIVSMGSSTGMIMDFNDLSQIVNRRVIQKLDHTMLNDIITVPTAEEIAEWIFHEIEQELGPLINKVRVWETRDSFADYMNVYAIFLSKD